MTPNTIILGFGALLILIGILGGGFEIRELKIPKVEAIPRTMAGVVGIILMLIGIGYNDSYDPAIPTPHSQDEKPEPNKNLETNVSLPKRAEQPINKGDTENSTGNIDETLNFIVTNINSTSPMMLSPDVRLDNAFATEKTLTLNLTLMNYSAASIVDQAAVKAFLSNAAFTTACTNYYYKRALDLGASISFVHRRNDGYIFYFVTINRQHCEGTH